MIKIKFESYNLPLACVKISKEKYFYTKIKKK